MSKTTLITNAKLVNEMKSWTGWLLIEGEFIQDLGEGNPPEGSYDETIDAEGKVLMPGVIDDQVHFREPGLTHKAEIATESRAAAAGGITSYMEMPNTVPNTLTQELLEDKYRIAADRSMVNYSFFMGASNDNIEEVLKTDPKTVCGVKVFMGSSTGNMLVDSDEALRTLFSRCKLLIATHCEDEETVRRNSAEAKEKYGEMVPFSQHPVIRSEEACYLSSSKAVALAKEYGTRLHILHISTAKELELFSQGDLADKRITSEACIHHMWFTDADYVEKGSRIKWNPAVKTQADRDAIRAAVNNDVIDVIATDHAPHTNEEKDNTYFGAPSGGPLVQHALPAVMELVKQGVFTLEKAVEKMCHLPARCFDVSKRGFLRKGYFADLVLVDTDRAWEVTKDNLEYKCGWSSFEGTTFSSSVTHTFVNGHLQYHNGEFSDHLAGQRLTFDR